MFEKRDNKSLFIFLAFYILFIYLIFSIGSVERAMGQPSTQETLFAWVSESPQTVGSTVKYRNNAVIKVSGPEDETQGFLRIGYRTSAQAIQETLAELNETNQLKDNVRASVESNYRLLGPGGELLFYVRRGSEEAAAGWNFIIRILDSTDRYVLKTYRLKPFSPDSAPTKVETDAVEIGYQFVGKILIDSLIGTSFLVEIEDRFLEELHLFEVKPSK